MELIELFQLSKLTKSSNSQFSFLLHNSKLFDSYTCIKSIFDPQICLIFSLIENIGNI
jgi:hypothetical protein